MNKIEKRAQNLRSLKNDEDGLTTVEYIIILFLIAIAAIAAWQAFGDTLQNKVGDADGQINGL